MTIDNLIEDAEFLLDAGETPHHIAHRLGCTPGALVRRLHRAGRHDLAARLHPAERAA